MSTHTNELDNIFGDISQLDEAAQQVQSQMQPSQNQIVNNPNQGQGNQVISPPPSQPIKSQEEKVMDKYNEEKQSLFKAEKQLYEVMNSDSSGSIVRNFGLSQIVLKVGDEIDRMNGLVILRNLKSRCHSKKFHKDNKESPEEVSLTEKPLESIYEVWGMMEDGSLGLTASYSPNIVAFVISLRSGYDLPPEDSEDIEE